MFIDLKRAGTIGWNCGIINRDQEPFHMDKKAIKVKKEFLGVSFDVLVDPGMPSVVSLIHSFGSRRIRTKTRNQIIITRGSRNAVKISSDRRFIIISGPALGNLDDPFNLIGIWQAIIRWLGIHTAKRKIILLHASAAIQGGKAIVFGDDGHSMVKTLGSIETALVSKQYIGDEFLFLDAADRIIGLPAVPIHFRPVVLAHVKAKHRGMHGKPLVSNKTSGSFYQAHQLFTVKRNVNIGAFIFVYIKQGVARTERLSLRQANEALTGCCSAHIIKLLHPQYDRMRFGGRSDSIKVSDYGQVLAQNTIRRLRLTGAVRRLAKTIPCYRVIASEPCQIPLILSSLDRGK